METSTLPVDVRPAPWTGRFDGDGAEHRRWWQAISPYSGGDAAARTRPAVVVGFCSDEGVRRNQGRVGAAAAPAAIRAALGPLAYHLDRSVFDAGDFLGKFTFLMRGVRKFEAKDVAPKCERTFEI